MTNCVAVVAINGKTILSPKSFNEKDPIEEFSTQLRNSGNKDDYQLSRKLSPKAKQKMDRTLSELRQIGGI